MQKSSTTNHFFPSKPKTLSFPSSTTILLFLSKFKSLSILLHNQIHPHYINQPIVLINLAKNFPHLDLQKPKQPNPPICLIGDNYGIYTHWWVHIITVLTCGGQPVGGTRRKKREWDRERKKRKIVRGRERERERERERIDLTLEKRRIKK